MKVNIIPVENSINGLEDQVVEISQRNVQKYKMIKVMWEIIRNLKDRARD